VCATPSPVTVFLAKEVDNEEFRPTEGRAKLDIVADDRGVTEICTSSGPKAFVGPCGGSIEGAGCFALSPWRAAAERSSEYNTRRRVNTIPLGVNYEFLPYA
jgi:hypothetical protein